MRNLALLCVMFAVSACATLPNSDALSDRQTTLPNGLNVVVVDDHDVDDDAEHVALRLVVHSGFLHEADSERNLLHFIEHMAFNQLQGSRAQQIQSALDLEIGRHSNATVDFDRTLYSLDYHENSVEGVDQGIELLSIWARGLDFDPAEVEREKGVLREEWRLREMPEQRGHLQYLSEVLADSPHGERLQTPNPNIESVDAAQLAAFYQKHYYPENVTLVISGRLDKGAALASVEKHFGQWPASGKARKKYTPVTPRRPQFGVYPDERQINSSIEYLYEVPTISQMSQEGLAAMHQCRFVSYLINEAISENIFATNGALLESNSHCAITRGYPHFGIGFDAAAGREIEAAEFVYGRVNRISQEGFNANQFDHLRNRWRDSIEWVDSAQNYAHQAVRHAIAGEPVFSYTAFAEQYIEWLDALEIADAQALLAGYLKATPVVEVFVSDAVSLPSQPAFFDASAALASTAGKTVDYKTHPWALDVTPGSIVREEKLGKIKRFWLSNGMEVRFVKTGGDRFDFNLNGVGGFNRLSAAQKPVARLALQAMQASGLRNLDGRQLELWVEQNQISFYPQYGYLNRGLFGDAPVDRIEDAFDLIHVALTEARVLPEVWQYFQQVNRDQITQFTQHPLFGWNQMIERAVQANDPALAHIPLDTLARITAEDIEVVYRQEFAGAQNYVLNVSGNLSERRLKKALEASIASLPVNFTAAEPSNAPRISTTGKLVSQGSGEKETSLIRYYSLPRSAVDRYPLWQLQGFAAELSKTLFEQVRERDSLVYAIGGEISDASLWHEDYVLAIATTCDSNKVDEVVASIDRALAVFAQNPPAQSVLDKGIDERVEARKDMVKDSPTIVQFLAQADLYDLELADVLDPARDVESYTTARLATLAQAFVDSTQKLSLVLLP
ncbi:MAG: insulinase family protein [Gammaproteobacteria bacterium]|nr:insulinase family protein [Gammaproteobacteria bacterium]